MVPTCWLCEERAQQRNNCLCQHICLGKAAPQFSPWCQTIQFLLVFFSCFSSCGSPDWSSEGVNTSNPMPDPLQGATWNSKSFCLPQLQSLMVFTARSCRGFPSHHWNPGLGSLICGPHSREIPLNFYLLRTHGCGTSLFYISAASTSWCSFFFNSVVVVLPVSSISGTSEWWFFCSLVVILMWLWEEVSTTFTYAVMLTGSPLSQVWKPQVV